MNPYWEIEPLAYTCEPFSCSLSKAETGVRYTKNQPDVHWCITSSHVHQSPGKVKPMLAICGRAIDHRYNVLLVYLLGAIGNRWMCVSVFLFVFNSELRFRCDEYMCSVLDAIPPHQAARRKLADVENNYSIIPNGHTNANPTHRACGSTTIATIVHVR